ASVFGGGASFETYASGKYAAALDPGSWTLDFSKFGYFPASAATIAAAGSDVTLDRQLVRRPSGELSGTITGGLANTPLVDARLHLHDTPLATLSVAGGSYDFPDVPEDTWQLGAHRPGYQSKNRVVTITGGNTTTADLHLAPLDFYDNAETPTGWTLFTTGDNATTSGRWVQADPVGTGPQTAPAMVPLRDVFRTQHHPEYEEGPTSGQPEDDSTPAPGTICFITGNGVPGGSTGAADVDNGKTTLTTPLLNLSGRTDPHVTFYYWFVNDVGANAGEDPFDIAISNDGGTNWVPVASLLRATHAWEEYDFRVLDFVTLTTTMKVRFVAQDLGGGSLVEAGIDDFGWYDPLPQSGTPIDGGGPPVAAVLTAGPNPFLLAADLHLERAAAGPLAVTIFDPAGRRVRVLHDGVAPAAWSTRWDGRDDAGTAVPPGVYFVRAVGADVERSLRIVRLR
ncbi:MAG TPA: carboxypeptidase regulatory-like domain-containing protein, partial [Candidatus Eisenbacteria bacterium]